MLKAWIPSLNRAAQLNLLLESIERNAPGLFEIYVNYDYTANEYGEGYAKLINSSLGQANNVIWQRRGFYGKDFYYFLTTHVQDELFTHFVDDCIWYRGINLEEDYIRHCMSLDRVWGFNWRVGLDTTINNHRDRKQISYPKTLANFEERKICLWDYTEYNDLWENYFSFPYSLDGFTYRVADLLDYLSYVDISSFTDPAQVEHNLCRSPKRSIIERPWMVCPLQSNVFSNHLNSVHSRGYDPAGQFNVSYEWLNEQYLNGYKINIDSFDFSKIQCGHEQLHFEMVKV